jgi:hypothetical protein
MQHPIRRLLPITASLALAATSATARENHRLEIDQVVLISVDGLHAIDVRNYVESHPHSAFARLVRYQCRADRLQFQTAGADHQVPGGDVAGRPDDSRCARDLSGGAQAVRREHTEALPGLLGEE